MFNVNDTHLNESQLSNHSHISTSIFLIFTFILNINR